MARVNNTHAFSKYASGSSFSCENTQPPIPKITLKRKYGQHYEVLQSKLSKRKHSRKSGTKKAPPPEEDPTSDGKVSNHISPINVTEDVIAIDLSDDDSFIDEGLTFHDKILDVIEIDSSGEESETCTNHYCENDSHEQAKVACHRASNNTTNGMSINLNNSSVGASKYLIETCTHRENENMQPVQSVITESPLIKIDLVDLSSDEGDDINLSQNSLVKTRHIDMGQEVNMTSSQKKKVIRDLTYLSEVMYVIINSRRDYSARVLRSERLCFELTSKERTIAEDNYKDLISVYGCKFSQLFFRMESRFENITQDSFMLYNFIVYRLFVGINKIDHTSKISLELVKNLMLLLLKRNSHKSLVFEVFKEESAEDHLCEFESAFLDWSFSEAFIPIED